jgi:HEAT repeat protein
MGDKFTRTHVASRAISFALILVATTGLCLPLRAQVPGNEMFAKEPQTPLELWDAVDYLMRTGQTKKALPYLDKFVKSKPDDATLNIIRIRYGPGSILSLGDNPLTRPFAGPLADAMVAATRKVAIDPKRIEGFVAALTRTDEEQAYAVRRLRQAGADAVPFLVEALSRPGLSAVDRRKMLNNVGQLDRTAFPPLVAVLESPDPILAADAATALGSIGDRRSIPHLTFPAARPTAEPAVREAARGAIARLTGRSFQAQERSPAEVLTDAAWRFHRHQVDLGPEPVAIWTWDKERSAPVAKMVPRTEAEAILAGRFAKDALALAPSYRPARIVQLSVNLEKAIERAGFTNFTAQDGPELKAATAAGPALLIEVMKTAIADGKTDLAAVVSSALGSVIDERSLASGGRPHPLVDALYSPGRRLQFAAARAIVKLAPSAPFPGAGRVVPTLARFLRKQALPRAVVIDANPNRGSQLAGFLINLGYDSELELTGARGFVAAALSADVELVLISHDLFGQQWTVNETLANLKADSRTAAIPLFIYGPLNVPYEHPSLERDYPGIRFVVHPVDAAMLKQQIKDLPNALDETERAGYAREAALLLAGLAKNGKSSLAVDSIVAEQALSAALHADETSVAAATALSYVADPDAQRSLAELALDSTRPKALRRQSATELLGSIRRFGPLLAAQQEARLKTLIDDEDDPNLRAELEAISRSLRGFSKKDGQTKPPGTPVPATAPK